MERLIALYKKGDQVFAKTGNSELPVKAIFHARPLSKPFTEISVMGKESEIAFLNSLDELDIPSKKIAQEELALFYQINIVKRILKAETACGTRYMTVSTNRGDRAFAFKNPYVNVRHIDNTVIIRDIVGNTYQIADYAGLDDKSKSQLEKIL